jgi:hypothetical protein
MPESVDVPPAPADPASLAPDPPLPPDPPTLPAARLLPIHLIHPSIRRHRQLSIPPSPRTLRSNHPFRPSRRRHPNRRCSTRFLARHSSKKEPKAITPIRSACASCTILSRAVEPRALSPSAHARCETSTSESRTCSTDSVNAPEPMPVGAVRQGACAPRCACTEMPFEFRYWLAPSR